VISVRKDLIMATGRSDYPNQVNNVLGFPFIFRGALDVRATGINDQMKIAASHALADLAKQDVPEAVSKAYGGVRLKFGADYIIPKPFDTRVLWWEAGAVAKAAMDSGVAKFKIDLEEYRESLKRRIGATHEVLHRVRARAKAHPKRIVFPEGATPAILRACQTILDESIAHPILLGARQEIEQQVRDLELGDLLNRVEIVDPLSSPNRERYVETYWRLRQRKGISRQLAQRHLTRPSAFGMMMVHEGEADGLVCGHTMQYPETIRPALQIVGLKPEHQRVVGMYMMILKGGEVKFFADATVNVAPTDQVLADIAIQVADAVKGLNICPHTAMLSYSNFGSARYDQSERVARAVELVRAQRPDLEIDGEMQADVAVDYGYMKEMFPFSRLTEAANVLIFPNLSAGNVAYKLMQKLGGAEAVGPILLGIRKPITVLSPGCPVGNIVNMTAFTVMKAQGLFDSAAVEKMATRAGEDNPHTLR
jgi:malate dehydrogenase (oxaloacetate-decarboxylating)(NADP+)